MYGKMYNGHSEIITVNSGDYLRGSIQQTGRRALGLGVGDLGRELKPHRQVASHEKPRTGVRDLQCADMERPPYNFVNISRHYFKKHWKKRITEIPKCFPFSGTYLEKEGRVH